MDHKVGMYLCAGCGIGEAVDMEKLTKVAGESKPALTKTHPFFCSPEGVQLIKDDIAKEGVNAVVIAACSSRVNYDVFDFGPQVLIDRVNIREQVAWVQPPKHEDTQMMAEDYTIEQIQREFLFMRSDLQALEQTLENLFDKLARIVNDKKRGEATAKAVGRDVREARGLSKDLLARLGAIESRLTSREKMENKAVAS